MSLLELKGRVHLKTVGCRYILVLAGSSAHNNTFI